MFEMVFFILLAVVTTITAILVIVQRNPVASAIYLIITFFCLAGIYLLLNAQFIAIIQVLVYAGAIMVLFLFVIMLLNLEKEKKIITRHRLQKVVGVFLGVILLAQIGMIFNSVLLEGGKGNFPPEKVAAIGNTEVVARLLFTDFLLPFEITSVLLLVAIIGAIVLAKKQI
ncbi:MAG: NADH-quinone oxidoreductase subunit J [Deltaproteobacteria bacterium]|jgi:NADH-quinone oxidoreductase subunit J|nr:NADH-quinone oxidoreductase subunit J [Deltaproteobacteria bacterium]MDO9211655.1 NADH-quinone oxidoreductase subunit J [Deltaproteobacteria bacterium]OGP48383.1 MAG: NADH dehydrogenase [Deltaproteobacteria bacterium RBG_13_51_10]